MSLYLLLNKIYYLFVSTLFHIISIINNSDITNSIIINNCNNYDNNCYY